MSRGNYKKVPKEEKVRIVSMVIAGESIPEVSRKTKTALSTNEPPRVKTRGIRAISFIDFG